MQTYIYSNDHQDAEHVDDVITKGTAHVDRLISIQMIIKTLKMMVKLMIVLTMIIKFDHKK